MREEIFFTAATIPHRGGSPSRCRLSHDVGIVCQRLALNLDV
ncbi:uncharacterized protein G2W53_034931 [Senna tora]|uniref:Uncharacterized protein n=1 Tax=Senna tora TaxID=362788 RepID=A0A834W4F7_9FABA|nr:uncharacterized protein G2W53_034931 [Senna tora]